jgi:hypothetical protein
MTKENRNKNKSFVLRIDIEMMEAVEQWAEDEFRSVNGQILYLLEQALKQNGRIAGKKSRKSQNNPEND